MLRPPRTCVILQPSYIPWRGYFHQIHEADVFVFYDDVQFDRRGWRNRNRIKTANGPAWLTVPLRKAGTDRGELTVNDVEIDGDHWAPKHWRSFEHWYAKAPAFEDIAPKLEPFYVNPPSKLVDLTIPTTIELARLLGVTDIQFARSSELGVAGGRTERLVNICSEVEAERYVTGPSARSYIDTVLFERAGIELSYMHYDYPAYPQLYGAFEDGMSVVDLLFMTGKNAGSFIWG